LISLSPLSTTHPKSLQRLLVQSSIPLYLYFNLVIDSSLSFGSSILVFSWALLPLHFHFHLLHSFLLSKLVDPLYQKYPIIFFNLPLISSLFSFNPNHFLPCSFSFLVFVYSLVSSIPSQYFFTIGHILLLFFVGGSTLLLPAFSYTFLLFFLFLPFLSLTTTLLFSFDFSLTVLRCFNSRFFFHFPICSYFLVPVLFYFGFRSFPFFLPTLLPSLSFSL